MAFAGKRRAFGKLTFDLEFLTNQGSTNQSTYYHQPTLIRNFDSVLSPPLDSTLPETNSSHLKMDGWKTMCLSFWGQRAYFQGLLLLVSGRVVIPPSQKKFLDGVFNREESFCLLPKKLTWNLKFIIVSIGKPSSIPEFLVFSGEYPPSN